MHWGGPGVTFLGVIIGVWGTLLMSRPYHPYTTWEIVVQVLTVVRTAVFKGKSEAKRLINEISVLSAGTGEDRAKTLFGLLVLIVSFFLQTFGALLVIVDLAWK